MVTGNNEIKKSLSKFDQLAEKEINNKVEKLYLLEQDKLTIAIFDKKNYKWLSFESFLFSENTELETILKTLESSNSNYQKNYSKTTVILYTKLGVIIPNALFDEHDCRAYLKLNFDYQDTDYKIFNTDLKNTDAHYIYLIHQDLLKILDSNISDYNIVPHALIWLDFLPIYLRNIKFKENLFLNFSANNMDVAVFENGKLVFTNQFYVRDENDVLYYVLNIIENKKINSDNLHIFLAGNISTENEKMLKLKRVFNFCVLMKNESENKFEHLLSENESRELFLLLNNYNIN
jgi:hypothetical protein